MIESSQQQIGSLGAAVSLNEHLKQGNLAILISGMDYCTQTLALALTKRNLGPLFRGSYILLIYIRFVGNVRSYQPLVMIDGSYLGNT